MIDAIAAAALVGSLMAAITVILRYLAKWTVWHRSERGIRQNQISDIDRKATDLHGSADQLKQNIEKIKQGDVAETLANIMRGE